MYGFGYMVIYCIYYVHALLARITNNEYTKRERVVVMRHTRCFVCTPVWNESDWIDNEQAWKSRRQYALNCMHFSLKSMRGFFPHLVENFFVRSFKPTLYCQTRSRALELMQNAEWKAQFLCFINAQTKDQRPMTQTTRCLWTENERNEKNEKEKKRKEKRKTTTTTRKHLMNMSKSIMGSNFALTFHVRMAAEESWVSNGNRDSI